MSKDEDKIKSIAIVSPGFSLEPKTLEEAVRYAELIAKSSMIPDCFKGKAGDVLIAIQMGLEVGLKPLQALQNIAVISGKPVLYGDAVVAIVRASGTCEYLNETWDEKTQTATCRGKRKGEKEEIVRTFSMKDAETAGLAGKNTHKSYPKRMCGWRCKSWVLRDGWADFLKGFGIKEEMEGLEEVTTAKNPFMPEKIVDTQVVHPEQSQPAPTNGNGDRDKVPPPPPAILAIVPDAPKAGTVYIGVSKVMKKAIKDPKGKVDLLYIVHGDNGQAYHTMDSKLATMAVAAKQEGTNIEISFETYDGGLTIMEIKEAGDLTEKEVEALHV